jgi:hypothetical protein
MRYLTEDLYKRMQFFPMFCEEKSFQDFVSDYIEPVDDFLFDGMQHYKEDMQRLLPDNLKMKIFDSNGNFRELVLDEELYGEILQYRRNFNLEYENIWQILKSEREKVKSSSKEAIKKLTNLHMHDQQVTEIRKVNNKIFVELEEKEWGMVTLTFTDLEKFEIKGDLNPKWWLYEEIFLIEDNKYEFNVLFDNGEFSVIFSDFEIICEHKKYLNKVLAKYTPEKIDEKIEEMMRATQNTETGIISNDEILGIKELCFGDRGLIQEILMCVAEKRNFGDSKNLSQFENDISLLGEFIYNLLYDTINQQKGHIKGGFHTCNKLSKVKRGLGWITGVNKTSRNIKILC